MDRLGSSEEYEVKGRLDPEKEEALREIVTGRGETTRIRDIYFDDEDGSFYKAGLFLRVRNDSLFELKWTPDPDDATHSHSVEQSFRYPLDAESGAAVRRILAGFVRMPPNASSDLYAWGLRPLVTVSKTRTTYQLDGLTVAVDDVTGLGRFVEIEARELSRLADLSRFADMLGLTNLPVGYVEMVMKHTRPELYDQGRYKS